MPRILAVRLDSDGDVLLTGPGIRALAALGDVDLLASPSGAAAGRLLPDVADVLVFDAPWSGFAPPPVDVDATRALVRDLAARRYDLAVIFTSFHQSPLPMALLARLAGIGRIAATSEDYPGALLDVRHRRDAPPGGGHEAEAAVALAVAAGAPDPGPDGSVLAVRRPLPAVPLGLLPEGRTGEQPAAPRPAPAPPESTARDPGGFVVLHPGASVDARALTAAHAATLAAGLATAGYDVVVTGGPGERALAARTVAACRESLADHRGTGRSDPPGQGRIVDAAGRTSLAELAAVLDAATCVVVGNTGPAHLAAAVGTPVVSIFSPVVPTQRWAPYGVPTIVLGDQHAACRDTRARDCPVPGHPCLSGVGAAEVVAAVRSLTANPRTAHAGAVNPPTTNSPTTNSPTTNSPTTKLGTANEREVRTSCAS
ncbi:glycosyl transferase [Tersicoccus phoenicis]|uniref:Glycosyl transferase n=1 Tax=Tersicoccus phoenicis TaxID=554083 RepID=A0A1R1LP91_9MICC|nr:glycosyltransferase family 9 protein [Tersicoccus phoenicis]OMH29322.1 glycosyl transferase [Tersicoccus phoenicis]